MMLLSRFVPLLALLALVGCGDPCRDLQDVCNGCQDPLQKSSCEQAVDADSADRCDSELENFLEICP